jgi:hypothetical protein
MHEIPRIESVVATYRSNEDGLGKFRYWHVEPLLNQAADLFDRCLKERAEHNAFRAQGASLWQSLLEAEAEERVTDQRIDSTRPGLPHLVLQEEMNGKSAAFGNYDAVETLIGHLQGGTSGTVHTAHEADKHRNWIARKLTLSDVNSKQAQHHWELDEVGYRRASFDNARQAREARLRLMEDGAAHNYEEQCRDIATLLEAAYTDAIDRATVAALGMKNIYGYSGEELETALALDSPIIGAIGWVRGAIRWLAAFAQLDQEWSASFSLRALVGNATWTTAPDETGMTSLTFTIPEQYFASHWFVRLRGITMYITSGNGASHGPWSASVKLPVDALSYQAQPVASPISQPDLPPCHLGRIDGRDSPRQPEIAGAISLMNASPVGDPEKDPAWNILIRSPYGTDLAVSTLEDIILELRLVGRPR